jgi:hypothetical protein
MAQSLLIPGYQAMGLFDAQAGGKDWPMLS